MFGYKSARCAGHIVRSFGRRLKLTVWLAVGKMDEGAKLWSKAQAGWWRWAQRSEGDGTRRPGINSRAQRAIGNVWVQIC